MPATRRAEGIALFGISGMIPLSLGGLLGDIVLAHADYSALFVGVAACALSGVLCSLPLPESRPPGLPVDRQGHLAAMTAAPLRPVWFMTIGAGIGMSSYFVFLKTFVLDSAVGSVGGFFSVYAWTAIGLRLLFGHLPERMGLRRVLLPALLAMAAGLCVLGLGAGEIAFHLAAVLCGAGHGYVFPILSALALSRARASLSSTTISVYTAFFDLAVLIGGPLLGGIARAHGHGAMFTATGGAVMLSMLIFWAWDERFVSMSSKGDLPSRPPPG
jgi:predicted MFS family arabinose efflux permease